MVYGVYRHTLFHGCEGGLKGVTFLSYRTKTQKESNFQITKWASECMQRWPPMNGLFIPFAL